MLTLLLIFLVSVVHGKKLDVYWNSSNTIFDISNTDHIFSVKLNDRVTIKCPQPSDNYEFSNIYMVSEEEYTHCVLKETAKQVGTCDDSTRLQSMSITFRQVNPMPDGLEFEAGKSYYFITTSDGTPQGIGRRKGGMCSTKQMKMKFEIHSNNHHPVRSMQNPKFAARTYENFEATTPILYIIHTEGEDMEDLDDDSATVFSASFYTVLTVLVIHWF